jgi:hypothetical protein
MIVYPDTGVSSTHETQRLENVTSFSGYYSVVVSWHLLQSPLLLSKLVHERPLLAENRLTRPAAADVATIETR